jgi:glycosyltransferase involved in cell wall biosynthesis
MKIGFDAKRAFNNRSGLGNYSRDVIRAMVRRQTDSIYLYTPKVNPDIFSLGEFDKQDSTHLVLPKGYTNRKFKSYWRSFSVARDIKRDKIDLFHGLSNELPNRLDPSVKTVVTIHDLIFKRYPEWYKPFDVKMYDWKFKSACKKADKIIAISEQTKADIIDFYKIDPSKIEVIYQTCNDAFKTKADTKALQAVKDKYQLPDQFLLNVGTIEPRKNAFEIVKAIHQNKIDIPLFIVGRSTAYVEEVKNYIKEHQLEKQVKLLHEVSNQELPLMYQLATAFVYPSTFEGFGIPIIEALYSGTPVISSTGGCFSEAGGPDSIYVEARNTEALSKAIVKLISDKDLQKKMSTKGLEYVQRFNTDVVGDQLYNLYQNLTKQ